MIVFSDVHLQPDSAEVVLNEVLPGIVEAAQERDGPHTVACLGDFYHLRYRLEVWLQNAVLDFLRGPGGDLEWSFLPGNHDQIDLAGRNALEALGALPNVTVHTQPTYEPPLLWLPYRKNALEFVPFIERAGADSLVFIHHGFEGALRNNGSINETGLHPRVFSKFKLVLSGHYHKRQQLADNIYYVGSPYETRADEAGDPHGYLIVDVAPLKLTWVEKDWGPQHHKVWINEPGTLPTGTVFKKGDVVRAHVTRESAEAVAKQLTEAGVNFTLDYQNTDAPPQRLDVAENASLLQYAQAYVDAADTSLNKGRLMGVLRNALGIS